MFPNQQSGGLVHLPGGESLNRCTEPFAHRAKRGNFWSPVRAADKSSRKGGKAQNVDDQSLLALPTEPAGSGFVVIPVFSALSRPESFTAPVFRSMIAPVSHHIGTMPRVTAA